MNLTPTSSAAAALALGDALAIAVLTRRGFGPDDVARLHPGGSIGRGLVRVAELMHRGDDVPVVPDSASLEVLIREMSAKRLGCTGVVDAAGRLRGIVTDGDLRRAVERGAGRGRTIGIPTLNLVPPDQRKLLPPDGVYAVRVYWRDGCWGGMMNQGPRPTFGVTARGLEVHLFDFTGELYGETVTVEWVRRLRDVQMFASREALIEQLGRDAQAARETLNLVTAR